ncbi:MAG: hypothetical protein EOL93_00560 [Epsilonproteobacteria bacterium]|nr:hypothetical protein [Campylobacterota bacterium]
MGNAVIEVENEEAIRESAKGKYEMALIEGDLSKLSSDERMDYYGAVCKSVGLNPLTKPFEYVTLNGSLKLYARKDATDQLRKIYGVSIEIVSKNQIGDIFIVEAKATDKEGRFDTATGAVSMLGLKGSELANALMKAETKAKRRVTLSICGLGILDESEIEDTPKTRGKVEKLPLTTIDKFREKAISLGLPSPAIRDFAIKFGIKGKEADEKMEIFLADEDALKGAIEEFKGEVA